ncbi:uncharacterized protein BYT42DRAFT_547477 [Radiomyces spectabilis]|uniref:uncharacterized protein n=1 Tax=Radiomyces spectabilis TaxID=64574 RepID=UPI00221E5DD1|nr:uncharacterized protein BYT42DRAFT_547477 [Radiomyces spectabilis]KAI8374439.1 hypothetical protein BYT42DRAFT_547477 [Radiomyces spectabilis]
MQIHCAIYWYSTNPALNSRGFNRLFCFLFRRRQNVPAAGTLNLSGLSGGQCVSVFRSKYKIHGRLSQIVKTEHSYSHVKWEQHISYQPIKASHHQLQIPQMQIQKIRYRLTIVMPFTSVFSHNAKGKSHLQSYRMLIHKLQRCAYQSIKVS